MGGGLLNLTAYGNENVILNEILKKHFLKQFIKNILILVYNVLELIIKEVVY